MTAVEFLTAYQGGSGVLTGYPMWFPFLGTMNTQTPGRIQKVDPPILGSNSSMV